MATELNFQSLAEAVRKTAEAGRQDRDNSGKKWGERFKAAKDGISSAWGKVKERGKAVGSALQFTGDVMRGLKDPDARAQLGNVTKDIVAAAKDNLGEQLGELKDAAGRKKDVAVEATQTKLRELRNQANDQLVKPTVAKAREIGSAVKTGAETGALFTYVIALGSTQIAEDALVAAGKGAVDVAVGGYNLGKAGVSATVEGTQYVGRKAQEAKDAAVDKATKWSGTLKGFFSRRAEGFMDGMRARKADLGRAVNDTLASAGEKKESFFRKVSEVAASNADRSRAAAQEHRERANSFFQTASTMRSVNNL